MNLLPLCRIDDIPENTAVRVEVGSFEYAVFRANDRFYVTSDACTHGPGSLSEGTIDGCEIECPFHGGRFDLATGAPTMAPCFEPVRTWQPHIVDGRVCIDILEGR